MMMMVSHHHHIPSKTNPHLLACNFQVHMQCDIRLVGEQIPSSYQKQILSTQKHDEPSTLRYIVDAYPCDVVIDALIHLTKSFWLAQKHP